MEMNFTVESLEKEIKRYAQAYYTGEALISDSEFDELVEKLRDIDPTNKILFTPGWGYKPSGDRKSKHLYGKVGSLPKTRSIGYIKDYSSESKWVVMSPKLDGLSCVSYYHKGVLVKSVTRGDGYEGLDITDKFLSITDKISLPYPFTGGIRGEIVMSHDNWRSFRESHPEYKNSRNAAAGIINSKFSSSDDLKSKCSYLSIIPYKIVGGSEHFNSYIEMNQYISKLGFIPVNVSEDIDSYREFYENAVKMYPCDGLVFNFGMSESEGDDHQIDYEEIAFKFDDEKAESRVDHVEWNLTRTGKLMPVACIDPVDLDGATIKRVTCFNAQYVKDNRIGPDAYIEIQRSGMVIPDIQRVLVESPEFSLPTTCPKCGNLLSWKGTDLVCDNPKCSHLRYSRLFHWIKTTSAVKGVSTSGIDDLIDILGVTSVIEIYTLGKDEALERIDKAAIGPATRQKYKEMMEWLYIEYMDPRYFLTGLNIPGLGWTVATKIAKSPAFDLLTAGTGDENEIYIDTSDIEYELKKIPGIGSSIVESVMSNIDRIDSLVKYIKFSKVDEEEESSSERYFCVTGSLNKFGSRSELVEYANQRGWDLADIKNSEVLVTNDPDPSSSKGRKAKERGIPIITESQFLEMIK